MTSRRKFIGGLSGLSIASISGCLDRIRKFTGDSSNQTEYPSGLSDNGIDAGIIMDNNAILNKDIKSFTYKKEQTVDGQVEENIEIDVSFDPTVRLKKEYNSEGQVVSETYAEKEENIRYVNEEGELRGYGSLSSMSRKDLSKYSNFEVLLSSVSFNQHEINSTDDGKVFIYESEEIPDFPERNIDYENFNIRVEFHKDGYIKYIETDILLNGERIITKHTYTNINNVSIERPSWVENVNDIVNKPTN